MAEDRGSSRACGRSRSLGSLSGKHGNDSNCSSRSRHSISARQTSPLAVVDRLQKRLARLNDREQDLRILARSTGDDLSIGPGRASGHKGKKRGSSTPSFLNVATHNREASLASSFDPLNQKASLASTQVRLASDKRVVAKQASDGNRTEQTPPGIPCLQTPARARQPSSDALAPVERALSELRQAMATLPASSAGPCLPPRVSELSGLHLSTAEASLAKAMECLDASFVDHSLRHAALAATPPRMTRGESIASPDSYLQDVASAITPVSPATSRGACGSATRAMGHSNYSPRQVQTRAAGIRSLTPRLVSLESVDQKGVECNSILPTTALAAMAQSIAPGKRSKMECSSKSSTMSPSEGSCFSSSPSLASSLSIFEPPTPEPKQQLTAALVQTSAELEILAQAARRAAVVCPDSAPLVETLCAAISCELADLKKRQASGFHDIELDAESVLYSDRKIFELRAAIVEGLEALQTALAKCSDEKADARDHPFSRTCPSVDSRAPSLLESAVHEEPCKEKDMLKMFSDVASHMMHVVQEIREAKSQQAAARKNGLPIPRLHLDSPFLA